MAAREARRGSASREPRAESREPSPCPSPGRAVPRLNSGSRRRPPESFPAAPSRRGSSRCRFPFRRLGALAGRFRRSLPAAVLLALAALVTVLPVPPAQAQQALEVGADWSLKPAAIGRGGQFRLLFITSNTRNAESAAIATYNGFVRTRLWDRGHAAFDRVSGSDDFANVVASTSTFDARDNAGMTGTGVPIYWVNGSKVADHYADFFDGTWDDDQNSRNEQGRSQGAANGVFTGSSPDGTASLWPLGGGESVTIARPSASGISPVGSDNSGEIRSASETRPFYGITRIFTVRRAQIATASIQSAPRDMTGGYAVGETIRVRIGFNEAVDVTPASDPPSVWLRVGNEVRRASYASGSGTANLEFTYTVERGDLDSDGVSLCSDTRLDSACGTISLNGGTITARADNAAVPVNHPELRDQAAHRIDGNARVRGVPHAPAGRPGRALSSGKRAPPVRSRPQPRPRRPGTSSSSASARSSVSGGVPRCGGDSPELPEALRVASLRSRRPTPARRRPCCRRTLAARAPACATTVEPAR